MSDFLEMQRDFAVLDIRKLQQESLWLQQRSLGVAEAGLDIDTKKLLATKRNAFLLQEVKETLQQGFIGLSQQIDYQISYLGLQLESFSNLVIKKISNDERENFARDVIFNLKKINESLSQKKDKKFIALEAKKLLSQIDTFKINTQSFTQIQDKEYFLSTLESIQVKYNDIPDDEKKEIENFYDVYFSVKAGLKKLEEIEKIKLANFPEKIEEKEKPNWDGILLIEGELLQELKNPYRTLELRGPQLKNFISKVDELPDLFEKFFDAKQKYTIQNYEYTVYQEIKKLQEKAKLYAEFLTNLQKCINASNDYIQKNPAFAESYSRFDFDELEAKIVDYESLQTEAEKKKSQLKNEVNNQYLKYKAILSEKMNGVLPPTPNNEKSKTENKILPLIIIFGIVILVSFFAYKFSSI